MKKRKPGEDIYRSVCRVCHGGCGALVSVKGAKVIKIKGDPGSPFSKGWMCPLGLNSVSIANHPDRLRKPLRRAGKRGSGRWKEVSWDEALDDIASKLDGFRKGSGAESIALGQGTGRHHYMHTIRFANILGTPNWYEPGLANCFMPRVTVSNITYGGFVVGDYYGKTLPKCVLVWGRNPFVSNADGMLSTVIKRAFNKGAVGISVDPRRTETAKQCKYWLPLRPGTDAALALAMINSIIEEKLYDKAFVKDWVSGFERLKEHVDSFTPEWAEKITWIKSKDIKAAARGYATIKPATLEWGVGIEQSPNSLQTLRALAILRGLTGNIDIPGGDILGMNAIKGYPTLRYKLPKEMWEKRLGSKEFKLLGGTRAFTPSAHIPAVFKAMRDADPYRIRALLIFGNNPLATVANPRMVYEALKKLDLLVVTDLFMTPSAAMADYVLPAAFWTEVKQIRGYPSVADNLVMAQKAVTHTGECRQDEWIMDELAKRLKLPNSDESLDNIMDGMLRPLKGVDYNELKKRSFAYPAHKYRKYKKAGFKTPSGKVELYSRVLEEMGYDPLPTFKEPPEGPLASPEVYAEFPYVLITGSRRREYFHSEHRQVARLRNARKDPQADMHPDAAKRHGIKNGDWVIISSPRGSIRMKACVTKDIAPRVINVDHGWWFPEKGGPDYGVWESNANLLTSDEPPYDPAFGTYQLKALLCKVEKEPLNAPCRRSYPGRA